MTEQATPAAGPKPKKSVALSGVAAGNTALCTVGRTGNDLHYRGYDILDLAEHANSRRSPTSWSTARCPTWRNWTPTRASCGAARPAAAVKHALEQSRPRPIPWT